MVLSSVKLRPALLGTALAVAIVLLLGRCSQDPSSKLQPSPAAPSALAPQPSPAALSGLASEAAAIQQTAGKFSQLYLEYRWDDPANQIELLQPLVTPELMDRLRASSSALAGRAELASRHEIGQVVLTQDAIAIQPATAEASTATVWTYPQLEVTSDHGSQTYKLALTLQLTQLEGEWRVAEVVL